MNEIAQTDQAEMADAVAADELRAWEVLFEKAVEKYGPADDGSHDIGHCRRVWHVAQLIAADITEPVDRLVLLAAAYFHDIVALEKSDPRRGWSSQMAAARARSILLQLRFPTRRLEAVCHAIEAHSFSAGIGARSIEAKILQDADRLDTLGAIGLARIFYVGGRIGTKLFDDRDPLAMDRNHDDRRFILDHFHTKVLRLPQMMNTPAGRAIANERTLFIQQFLNRLMEETGINRATL